MDHWMTLDKNNCQKLKLFFWKILHPFISEMFFPLLTFALKVSVSGPCPGSWRFQREKEWRDAQAAAGKISSCAPQLASRFGLARSNLHRALLTGFSACTGDFLPFSPQSAICWRNLSRVECVSTALGLPSHYTSVHSCTVAGSRSFGSSHFMTILMLQQQSRETLAEQETETTPETFGINFTN